jgi:hypothetical protein
MPKFVKFSKNSVKREMTTDESVTVKVSDDPAPDLSPLPPRLAARNPDLKSKKNSMKVSTIVQND